MGKKTGWATKNLLESSQKCEDKALEVMTNQYYMQDLLQVSAVMDSCNTEAQILIAERYMQLFFAKWGDWEYNSLYNRWYETYLRIMNQIYHGRDYNV